MLSRERIVTKIKDKHILFGKQQSALRSFLNPSLRFDTVVNECLYHSAGEMQGGKGVGTEGISMTTRSPSHFHIHRLVLLMNRVKRSRTVSQSQRDSVLSNRADSC